MSAKVFINISKLLTLKGAAKKQARHVVKKDLSIVNKAAIISVKGKIVWVGKESQWLELMSRLKIQDYKIIDLKGQVVMPAFVECHTHSVFAGDRAHEFELRNQGISYAEIARQGGGILSTVKQTRKATELELFESLQQRIKKFIQQGVATVEVKSGYGLNFKTEEKLLKTINKIKKPRVIPTYLGAHTLSEKFKESKKYIDHIIKNDLPRLAKNKLAQRVDIFVEKDYFTPQDAERLFKVAKGFELSLAMHTEQFNKTMGYKVAIKSSSQSADHLIQLGESDIKALASSEVTCVLLPGADFYLDMDYPKARSLIDQGARVAVATDFNPGSCPTQDLGFIGFLSRLKMKMTLPEVIVSYTLGAAYALGLQNQVGSVEIGKSCDLCVLDQSWENLFYQVGYHPVSQTWWQGRKIF